MKLLHPKEYHLINKLLDQVTFNHLFAKSIRDQIFPGAIYANNHTSPQTCLICHPYGLSILIGDLTNEAFNNQLSAYLHRERQKNSNQWLQAFPSAWHPKLQELIEAVNKMPAPHPHEITNKIRINFKFQERRYLRTNVHRNNGPHSIIRTTPELFEEVKGSVVPKRFWKDGHHFYKHGIGYTLILNHQPVATAYSAFIHDTLMELAIETQQSHRGKGYARAVCCRLIDHCLNNKLEPVWSCNKENTGSYKLAQKLGFMATIEMPTYQISTHRPRPDRH